MTIIGCIIGCFIYMSYTRGESTAYKVISFIASSMAIIIVFLMCLYFKVSREWWCGLLIIPLTDFVIMVIANWIYGTPGRFWKAANRNYVNALEFFNNDKRWIMGNDKTELKRKSGRNFVYTFFFGDSIVMYLYFNGKPNEEKESQRFFLRSLKSGKKSLKEMNPINSIRFDGTLGFRIGDSLPFALSRLRHLSIKIEGEGTAGFDMVMGDNWRATTGCRLTVGVGLFNNIKEISISFNRTDEISGFLIYVDYEKEGRVFMSDFIKRQISLYLKMEHNRTPQEGFAWVQNGYVVMFDVNSMYIGIHRLAGKAI